MNNKPILPSHYARWLLEAKDEHTKLEAAHGPDMHWENWYGSYLAYRSYGNSQQLSASWATEDYLGPNG